jgi:hydrogenase-4 component B
MAAVALTVGFAGVTFVRLVGLIAFGRGTDAAREPGLAGGSGRAEYGWAGRAAVAALAAFCMTVTAVTPLEIRVIAAGLSPVVPSAVTTGALKSPWVLQPVFAGFSILSPSWLWLEIPSMLVIVGLLTWAASGRRMLRIRRVPAWRSATIGVEGTDSYTAFGYANPTRRVLTSLLHTRAEVRQGVSEDDEDGAGAEDQPHLEYVSDVVEVVETYVYQPGLRPFAALVSAAKRLQSGRLDAYLLYMLIALIAVIAVVTALA